MLCSSCTRWECQPEDVFCSFCGHPAKRLELSPAVVAFTGGNRAKPQKLTLMNRSPVPLTVRIGQSRTTREWIKVNHPDAERKRVGWTKLVASVEDGKALPYPHQDAEIVLPSGGEYGVEISVEGRLAVPEKDLSGALLLAGEGLLDTAGNPVISRPLFVTWGAAPEPRILGQSEVTCRLGGKGATFDLRINNPRRGFVTLRETPRASVPWIEVKTFPQEPIGPGSEALVTFATDPSWAPSGSHKVEITMSFHEVEKPLLAALTVHVRQPPQLLINRTHVTFPELTSFSENPQKLILDNRGEEDLVLIGDPVIEPATLRQNVWIRDDDPSHRRIKSDREGHTGKVLWLCATGRDLAPGEYTGTLRVSSNDPNPEQAEVRLTLSVRKLARTDKLLSLDFGTTNSCIAAAFNPTDFRVLDLSGGAPVKLLEVPTVVYFKSPGEYVVGEEAKNMQLARPDRTVSSIKLQLGSPRTRKILGTEYTATDIARIIIRRLWERAAVALGAEPNELVVTVPCHFGKSAIEALLTACRDAGFNPKSEPRFVLDEPSAAAYNYLIQSRDELAARGPEHRALVYDFGGGTLDIALLSVRFGDNPLTHIRVLDVDGVDLGGDDLDEELLGLYLERLQRDQAASNKSKVARVDIDRILQREEGEADLDTLANRTLLRRAAEVTKKRLSTDEVAPFPSVTLKDRLSGSVYLDANDTFLSVTRAEFEERVLPRLKAAQDVILKVLERTHVQREDVDLLLLTGGSSRTPLVRRTVSSLFPKAYVPSPEEIPPKQSVARGAVIRGYLAKFEQSRFSQGAPEVVIEPMRERAFFSIGTLDGSGKFREIVPRGGLPVAGVFPLTMPEQRAELYLVRNNGTTNPRFQESQQLEDLGSVAIDPSALPGHAPGTRVNLKLALHPDRKLLATIDDQEIPVNVREGALR